MIPLVKLALIGKPKVLTDSETGYAVSDLSYSESQHHKGTACTVWECMFGM